MSASSASTSAYGSKEFRPFQFQDMIFKILGCCMMGLDCEIVVASSILRKCVRRAQRSDFSCTNITLLLHIREDRIVLIRLSSFIILAVAIASYLRIFLTSEFDTECCRYLLSRY